MITPASSPDCIEAAVSRVISKRFGKGAKQDKKKTTENPKEKML